MLRATLPGACARLTFEVIGRGAVTVVDGSHVVTDAFQTKGYRPMMVSGALLHSLPAGYRFDLRARALIPPADQPVRRRRRESPVTRLRRLSRETAIEGADSFDLERRRRRGEELEASE